MRSLIIAALAFTLACGPDYPAPTPDEPIEAPAPAPEDAPGQSDEAPGQEKKVEPAQAETCTPSLTVNGTKGAKGGTYVTVQKNAIPDLEIEVIDCPNLAMSEAERDTVAWRLNFGGASTGHGSGEVHVVLTKRGALPREFQRLGSDRVTMDAEIAGEFRVVDGGLVADSGAWRSEGEQGEDGPALFKGITAPTRRTTPTDRIDTPVAIAIDVDVSSRTSSGSDSYPVEIKVNYFSATGQDMAVVVREACSAEAQASPSRFDC